MARMVPDRPANTSSAAEVLVFESIRSDLPGEWTALHSVGLTIHNAKPWAELDFVLIGPPGVFCLEVKGGLVSREEGKWHTTPRQGPNAGKRQPLKESPFEQVGSASAELFHFLDARSTTIGKAMTGYAVALPDVAWTTQGPDIDAALVYDQTDTLRSFDQFMSRVVKRWAEKVGSNWNRKPVLLGRADRQLILDSIRGDFLLVPSLRATADLAERELIRLTDEQCSLFGRLASNDRVVAKGGAGTGKTVIAVEEARRLASLGKRVLYVCFSRNLARYVATLLAIEPLITVSTLHGLMMDLVDTAGRRSDLPEVSEEDLMALFLPELALGVLLDRPESPFDSVVVDEGQDLLRENYLDVIEALVGGDLRRGSWRVFLDPNQNIFGGVAASALGQLRDAGAVEWPLTVNCRNTAPIAAQVSLLSGVPLTEVLAPDGPDVAIRWYETADDQRILIDNAVAELTREGIEPGRMVVLSRFRLEASGMLGAALPITDVSRGNDGIEIKGVRFATLASFTGLASDVVLLTDVDDLLSDDGLASVYVGASRAKAVLYVFVASSQKERFQDLAKEFGRAFVARTS
jgi:superfamily I DNA/RNA helicase